MKEEGRGEGQSKKPSSLRAIQEKILVSSLDGGGGKEHRKEVKARKMVSKQMAYMVQTIPTSLREDPREKKRSEKVSLGKYFEFKRERGRNDGAGEPGKKKKRSQNRRTVRKRWGQNT